MCVRLGITAALAMSVALAFPAAAQVSATSQQYAGSTAYAIAGGSGTSSGPILNVPSIGGQLVLGTCVSGAGGSVAGPGAGLAFNFGHEDTKCTRRLDAQTAAVLAQQFEASGNRSMAVLLRQTAVTSLLRGISLQDAAPIAVQALSEPVANLLQGRPDWCATTRPGDRAHPECSR